MTAYTTQIGRNIRGELSATSKGLFGTNKAGKPLQLEIETSKGSRGLSSSATVYAITGDGMKQHCFSFGGADDDYRVKLISDPTKRATQKAIETMHAQALAMWDSQIEKAKARYGLSA